MDGDGLREAEVAERYDAVDADARLVAVVERVDAGFRGPWESLWSEVAGIARSLKRTNPLEATQEVTVRLFLDPDLRHRVAACSHPRAFLRRMLGRVSAASGDSRSLNAGRVSASGVVPAEPPIPAVAAEQHELVLRVAEARDKLATEDRQLLQWKFVDGRSLRWIAQRRGTKHPQVSRRIGRILDGLRQDLEAPAHVP